MKFKVGDKVVINHRYPAPNIVGRKGVILSIFDEGYPYSIVLQDYADSRFYEYELTLDEDYYFNKSFEEHLNVSE